VAAHGIFIVHPNWWGMPPAILKGWIDHVLRMEAAYRFVANDQGGVPVGLLQATAAIVFNMANTPEAHDQKGLCDPLERLWKQCVFNLCGDINVHRRTFAVVVASASQQRARWLAEMWECVARCFPPE